MAKGSTLTLKEKRFADKYLETGNKTEAIVAAGYKVKDRKIASAMGSQNYAKLSVREYIESQSKGAMSRIVEMSINANTEQVKLAANKDILDRGGYRAPERVDVTSGGEPIVGFEYVIPVIHEETTDTSDN